MAEVAFMHGNAAVAHGALAAGCRFFAGYPITPSNEISEIMAYELPKLGGKFIQMEDEIASMAAVIGASLAGAKSLTATSGPGFSLKQENLGFAYEAEIPVVVVDVMRGGPSTGLPTKIAQQEAMQARWGTHGDHATIAYAPSSVQECYDTTIRAFNMAEKFRQPVLIMSDEVVGHMSEKVVLHAPDVIISRVRPSTTPDMFIPYHANPQTDVPEMASFGDGYRWHVTGLIHNDWGFPTNHAREIDNMMRRLMRKVELCRDEVVQFETRYIEDADVIVLAYGSIARSALNAVHCAREVGIKVGFFRPITIWPFPDKELYSVVRSGTTIIVPEMNCGQMVNEVERAMKGKAKIVLQSRVNGKLFEPDAILARIKEVC